MKTLYKIIIVYLLVIANFTVFYIGEYGLLITAFILIPFDFIVRAYFHEKWHKGWQLWTKLLPLIFAGSLISYIINHDIQNIAMGSFTGFMSAGIVASIFYQFNLNKKFWYKVNGSDLFGIMTDSFLFQVIAFGHFSWFIMINQTLIKFVGGLMWYYILFYRMKIYQKW